MGKENIITLGRIGNEEIKWDLISTYGNTSLYYALNVIDGREKEDSLDIEDLYKKLFNKDEISRIYSPNGKHIFLPEISTLVNKYGDDYGKVFALEYAKSKGVYIFDANEEAYADSLNIHVSEEDFKNDYAPYDGMSSFLATDNNRLVWVQPDGYSGLYDDYIVLFEDQPIGIRPAIWIINK